MRRALLIGLLVCAPGLFAAGPDGKRPAAATTAPAANSDLDQLVQWMTGSFSSAEQHAKDPDFFDIRLEMRPIWTDRTDGRWLYVEQAVATMRHQPYRQRIYYVTSVTDGKFQSAVFELPGNPLAYAGAWGKPELLKGLAQDKLLPREGCTMHLTRQADGSFAGGTEGRGCASSRQGAKYATSEARIYADRLVTLDRGYDEKGRQVWGSQKGGYIFKRVSGSDDGASGGPDAKDEPKGRQKPESKQSPSTRPVENHGGTKSGK